MNGLLRRDGFALPVVLISSVVMMTLLLISLTSISSIAGAIQRQYETKLLDQAGEAGVEFAKACLNASNQVPGWSDGSPLRPNTNCSGVTITSAPVPSPYVVDTTNIKTSFSIGLPSNENGITRLNITARLEKHSTSGGGTPQVQTKSIAAVTAGEVTFSTIAFGYCASCGAGDGAQFAVVLPTGQVKTLGQNDNGRLGSGNTNSGTEPKNFILPAGEAGVAAYSNFLSIGRQISVITASGKVYSAGSNEFGQLGNTVSNLTTPIPTPVQYGSLGNAGQPTASFVGMSNYATYVMGSDNNLYSAGSCVYGLLGRGCSSGNYPAAARVSLPSPTSDPNTQPQNVSSSSTQADNIVIDRFNVYVRMKGGAAYGWGINDNGQLGTGDTTQSNTPVRLRAISSNGAPYLNVKQLAFNGTAIYALDTSGRIWAAGSNEAGEQLGAGTQIQNPRTGLCLRKDPSSSAIRPGSCNFADGWQYFEWWPDRTLRFRTDSYSYEPTDSMLCVRNSPSYDILTATTCNTNDPYQLFSMSDSGSISAGGSYGYGSGCAQMESGLNAVFTDPCDGNALQQWVPLYNPYFRPVPRPPGNPKYTKITTDNRATLLLDENGNAWGAGGNNRGQLGNGNRSLRVQTLTQVNFPASCPKPVKDFYTTEAHPLSIENGTGYQSYNNSYFVMNDGSVCGAGANNHGQLGNECALPCSAAVTLPVKMTGLPSGLQAKSVQAGSGTAVILTVDGKVYTVGNNANGQLGDGSTTSSSTPKANKYTNYRSTLVY